MQTRSIATVVLLLLTACTAMNDTAASGGAIALDGTSWTLTSISGHPPAAGSSITLQFADGSATGSGGCNQYRATCIASGTTLTFGLAAATLRGCADAARNAQETAYFDALTHVGSFTASDTQLTLSSTTGTPLLTFTRNR